MMRYRRLAWILGPLLISFSCKSIPPESPKALPTIDQSATPTEYMTFISLVVSGSQLRDPTIISFMDAVETAAFDNQMSLNTQLKLQENRASNIDEF